MAYLKPQSPLQHRDGNYFYPLTTSDQIIMEDGSRLESLFKKTIKENITLLSSNWSETLPYTQIITLTESTDDYNVDANIAYGDGDNIALNKAAGCISYIKKNHKEITFYCLKSKPEVDIPIEITGTCRNTIATIEEGIKLNFDIVAYATEEQMLADAPAENTIGVITDIPITGYKFSTTEPEGMVEGEVWFETGSGSNIEFAIIDDIYLCVIAARQYINNEWVNITVKSYYNNKWNEPGMYLIRDGKIISFFSSSGPTVSFGETDNGVLLSTETAYGVASYMQSKPLDFNLYKNLIIKYDYEVTGGAYAYLGHRIEFYNLSNSLVSYYALPDTYTIDGQLSIDVSQYYTQEGYIRLSVYYKNSYSGTGTCKTTIHELRLF